MEDNVVDLCSDEEEEKKPPAINNKERENEEVLGGKEDDGNDSTSLELEWSGPPIAWKRPKAHVKFNWKTMKPVYQKNVADPNKKAKELVSQVMQQQLQSIITFYTNLLMPTINMVSG